MKNLNRFLLVISIVFVGCKTKQINNNKETSVRKGCFIRKTDNSKLYNDLLHNNNDIVQQFLKSKGELNILKKISDQGYDLKEEYKFYTLNTKNQFLVYTENGIENKNDNLSGLQKELESIKKLSLVAVCSNNSSRKKTVQYFIRTNDKGLYLSLIVSAGELKDFKGKGYDNELRFLEKIN